MFGIIYDFDFHLKKIVEILKKITEIINNNVIFFAAHSCTHTLKSLNEDEQQNFTAKI